MFRLELWIGDLLAVGGPGHPTRENSQRRDVQHFLVRAIEICTEQTVLASFGIVATNVCHTPAIGGEADGTIHVANHRLWGTSQNRDTIEIEIGIESVFGLAEINVVSVGRERGAADSGSRWGHDLRIATRRNVAQP